MANFVLEIGTEELPARFLPQLSKELNDSFCTAFQELGYIVEKLSSYATPRRLVVHAEDIDSIQPVQETVVLGPPLKISFDSEGNPTKAAIGFATTLGVTIHELTQVVTEKGEYLTGLKKTGGTPTLAVLAVLCPEIITKLSAPKRMRWGSGNFSFARPIRWIMALLDSEIISFELAGIYSNRTTFGHRIYSAEPIEVSNAEDYFNLLKYKGRVILDANERKDVIFSNGNAIAADIDGEIVWKDVLLQEVTGIVEHPYPLLGDIDPIFLALPQEILLTSMETHQKSFGIVDQKGQLLPHFLTILNMTPSEPQLVKKGWERVLQARLEDARFFWEIDVESSLDEWKRKLESLTFLAPLGSMAQKTQRLSSLCAWLADSIGVIEEKEDARQVGVLSKVDLVSKMVEEFPELQGIMGSIYAMDKGVSTPVSKALAEQYLPAGPDTPVPKTHLGSILSIADKIDTLVGCFGLRMIPTGAADPYALRRNALGIIRILLENEYAISFQNLITTSYNTYQNVSWKVSFEELCQKLNEFFFARLKNYLLYNKYESRIVDAVLAVQSDELWFIKECLHVLTTLSQREDFYQIIYTLKRVVNIVKKYEKDSDTILTTQWKKSLLKEKAEQALSSELISAMKNIDRYPSKTIISMMLNGIFALTSTIDAFFDQVMVMSDDIELRINRLSMLKALTIYMEQFADFSALQI